VGEMEEEKVGEERRGELGGGGGVGGSSADRNAWHQALWHRLGVSASAPAPDVRGLAFAPREQSASLLWE